MPLTVTIEFWFRLNIHFCRRRVHEAELGVAEFLSHIEQEEVDLAQLGIRDRSKQEIINNIRSTFREQQ